MRLTRLSAVAAVGRVAVAASQERAALSSALIWENEESSREQGKPAESFGLLQAARETRKIPNGTCGVLKNLTERVYSLTIFT